VHAQELATAAEEDRPGDGKPEERKAGTWYGWQIAISDAASIGLTYWGVEANRAVLLYGGLSLFLVVPPAIHGAHDSSPGGGAVLASFGTRLLVPFFMILKEAGGRSDDGGTGADLEAEDQPQPSYGLMAIMSALDIGVWSIPAIWNSRSPRNRETATLRPRITLHPQRAVFSADGVF
jgi:hypothetical protein